MNGSKKIKAALFYYCFILLRFLFFTNRNIRYCFRKIYHIPKFGQRSNVRLYLIFLFCFLSNVLTSQEVYVEYNVLKLDTPSQGIIIANNTNSFYTTGLINKTNNDTVNRINSNTFFVKPKKTVVPEKKYYSTKSSNNMHIVILQPNKEPIIALDLLPEFDWKINSNQTKKILGFECIQAQTTFRGSDIVAYFTTEIPIPFGPFKFRGLPGLILEVYNVNDVDSFEWKASSIRFPYKNDNKSKLMFDSNKYDVEVLTLESLIKKYEGKISTRNNRIKSSLPRGASANSKIIRKRVEKIYEWEK